MRDIHRPSDAAALERAKRRLIFEELFMLAAGVGLLRTRARTEQAAPMQPHSLKAFYTALPFELTGAQRRAIADLTDDLQKPTPANRLVQGDVGSGKTMVAAAGAYFAFLSGAQSAMMAPTELLARQHYEGLKPLCEKLGMKTALLIGSLTPAQKRAVYNALETGEIDLCFGTHALISQGVHVMNRVRVITDEQHRFGVAQRAKLRRKGRCAHTLVMSATPIPRTLALMIYGELDFSVIAELPPGRRPVLKYKIRSGKRERAFGFIRKQLDRGLQAYIVCPRVEAGEEDMGLHAATEYMMDLSSGAFTGYTVGLLHGRMKASEKERVMESFQRGEIQLLVSTTVVEVGVDVPNAVIMMIENAERFGLSQLHQLRGRVGRGKHQSYCILVDGSGQEGTRERLTILSKSNDGFYIASEDLKLRGPGDIFGLRQSGDLEFKLADIFNDANILKTVSEEVNRLLDEDPELISEDHAELGKKLNLYLEKSYDKLNL